MSFLNAALNLWTSSFDLMVVIADVPRPATLNFELLNGFFLAGAASFD